MEKYLPKALPFCPAKETRSRIAIQPMSVGKEPEAYYLQEYRGAIHNQSYPYKTSSGTTFGTGSNSCVADSFAAVLEKIDYHKGGNIVPSVSMIYGLTGLGVDDGMYNDDAFETLRVFGALPFQYLKNIDYTQPYSDALSLSDITYGGITYKGARTVFNELRYSQASVMERTKLSNFWEKSGKLTNDDDIGTLQRAIKSSNQGVIFTYWIDNSFDNVGSTGILKNDKYEYKTRGSHVSAVVGWVTIDNVLHWIVQNSWGQDHGDKGYIYMPCDWPGLNYFGVITGTAAQPAQFTDIPKKAEYTGSYYIWDAIPNAVSYEYAYRVGSSWSKSTTTKNQASITSSSPMQFHYRTIYSDGTKGLWSNPTRVLTKNSLKGISIVSKTTSGYNFYLDNAPSYKYTRDISVTNKNGANVNYTLNGIILGVSKPPVNDYYDIKAGMNYLFEATLGNVSKTMRIYGNLDWQYMKDDANKEIKLTAKEWNDCCEKLEYTAKNYVGTNISIPRVTPGEEISAKIFNDMLYALRTGFKIGSTAYITLSLIPVDVSNTTPITKQHFIQLRNAINSITK